MATTVDLIIVGAGLAGSAAAWAASARGADVVVLEAFGPGHKNGSSHGSARIFRRAYPDPRYVRLAGVAGERWRELADQAGERLLTQTGGLDFGAGRDPRQLHDVLTGCGVAAELLPPEEAARRWPSFDFTGAGEVMFHGEAGVLDPHNAMAAMLRLAAAHGADVRFDTPVTRLAPAPSGDGAVAHTDSGSFTAPVIVVAAGAWLAPLLGGLVDLPPLTVTQQQIAHFAPAPPPEPRSTAQTTLSSGTQATPGSEAQATLSSGTQATPGSEAQTTLNSGTQATTGSGAQAATLGSGRQATPAALWPIFIYQDGGTDCYGLPGGRDGGAPGAIKVGEHAPVRATTAIARDFGIDPAVRARLVDFVTERIPGLTATPVNEVTCLYTRTANEDFILDRSGPFVVASPCSGHGAKFAPLLGEIIADLATGKPAPDPRFTLAAHRATRP